MSHSFKPEPISGNPQCRCDDCGHEEDWESLNDIVDWQMRFNVGGEVAGGECTKCGTLSYIIEKEKEKNPVYVVVHTHRFGLSVWLEDGSVPVSEEDMKKNSDFEADRDDEWIEIFGPMTVESSPDR